MRLKDQSYIARLGFGDEDRRMTKHDLGCRYLASVDKVSKLPSADSYLPQFRPRIDPDTRHVLPSKNRRSRHAGQRKDPSHLPQPKKPQAFAAQSNESTLEAF
ncbi:MAG: hypothetical protein EOP04_09375 [Proteobacteria bacterium]|nr:MAG: hypothetical protein EOP04_09375 [Pseudomonadota bacterium]